MTGIRKVLIVGAGVGGAPLALALTNQGIVTELIELENAVLGFGIEFTGNTLAALEKLDLAEESVAVGMPFEIYRVHDSQGKEINSVRFPHVASAKYPACISIERPAFAEVSRQKAVAAGAKLRVGLTVEHIRQDASGVDVTFSDGSTGRYDLVVGADGINSRVRALMFGDVEMEALGQSCWRWHRPIIPELTDDAPMLAYHSPKNKVVLARSGQKTMYVAVTEPRDPDVIVPKPELHKLLGKIFDDYTVPSIQRIRGELNEQSEILLRPFRVFFMENWVNGRVVLIGDASRGGTPHLGNFGGMALEDAAVLSEELGKEQPIKQALSAYVERRRDRVKLVWDASIQICRWEVEHADENLAYALQRETMIKLTEPI